MKRNINDYGPLDGRKWLKHECEIDQLTGLLWLFEYSSISSVVEGNTGRTRSNLISSNESFSRSPIVLYSPQLIGVEISAYSFSSESLYGIDYRLLPEYMSIGIKFSLISSKFVTNKSQNSSNILKI